MLSSPGSNSTMPLSILVLMRIGGAIAATSRWAMTVKLDCDVEHTTSSQVQFCLCGVAWKVCWQVKMGPKIIRCKSSG